MYLFGERLAASFANFVSPCVALRGDDLVEAAIDELDRAIVLNRDSYAAGFANHIPEILSARNSASHAVTVRAVNSPDEPQAFHIYVLPFSRIIKRHRIGMS